MSDFPKRIKYFRSLKNLSQAELAQKVGVSPKQISDYEVGTTSNPRRSTFMRLLEAFGISEVEFFASDCLYGHAGEVEPSGVRGGGDAISAILASPSRGKLISIAGVEFHNSLRKNITINIFSGTITRTRQGDDDLADYAQVYYLTGDKEACIYVHEDCLSPILDSLKNS